MIALSTRSLPPRGSVAELCQDAAQLQFRGLSVAAHDVAPRPGDLSLASTKFGVRIVNIKNGCLEPRTAPRRAVEELASLDEGRRARAVRSTLDHVAFAKALNCKILSLSGAFAEAPGIDERCRHLEGLVDRGGAAGELLEELRLLSNKNRERHLERYCRSLHEITRANTELVFTIPPSARPHELLTTGAIGDVLSDVKATNLSVWFDVGRARSGECVGAEPSVEILSKLASKIVGFDIHDCRGIREHIIPGEGEVDWKMIKDHIPRAAVRVIDLEAGAGAASIAEASRALQKLQLSDS